MAIFLYSLDQLEQLALNYEDETVGSSLFGFTIWLNRKEVEFLKRNRD